MAEIRGAEYDSVSSRLSSFCTAIAPDFCCLVSGINHTEDNPSGIPSTQAYPRKICFLFERRIRWRRAFFQLGRGKIKSWEGLRGGRRRKRTRSNSPIFNRDFLVPTGFTSSLLPLDRQWESRMMVKKKKKKVKKEEKPLNASRTGFASKRNGKLNEGIRFYLFYSWNN